MAHYRSKDEEHTMLTSAQRKYLRSQAHHLNPVAFIGKQGLSETVITAVDEVIAVHELIKVKFQEFKDEKRELAEELADATGAELAGVIGNIAILYRPKPNPSERKYLLP
jgi:RNA-binding protein